jgi:hypothetical protein
MIARISSVTLPTAGTRIAALRSADSVMKVKSLGRSPLKTSVPACVLSNGRARARRGACAQLVLLPHGAARGDAAPRACTPAPAHCTAAWREVKACARAAAVRTRQTLLVAVMPARAGRAGDTCASRVAAAATPRPAHRCSCGQAHPSANERPEHHAGALPGLCALACVAIGLPCLRPVVWVTLTQLRRGRAARRCCACCQ